MFAELVGDGDVHLVLQFFLKGSGECGSGEAKDGGRRFDGIVEKFAVANGEDAVLVGAENGIGPGVVADDVLFHLASDVLSIQVVTGQTAEGSAKGADAAEDLAEVSLEVNEASIGKDLEDAVDGLGVEGGLEQPLFAVVAEDLELVVEVLIRGQVVGGFEKLIVGGDVEEGREHLGDKAAEEHLRAFLGALDTLFVDGPHRRCEVVGELDLGEGLDPFDEDRTFAGDLVGFPIAEGAEVAGGSEKVEEVGGAGAGHAQDEDGGLDGREGGMLKTALDLVVVEEGFLDELFEHALTETIEAGGLVDAAEEELAILPHGGIEVLGVF